MSKPRTLRRLRVGDRVVAMKGGYLRYVCGEVGTVERIDPRYLAVYEVRFPSMYGYFDRDELRALPR